MLLQYPLLPYLWLHRTASCPSKPYPNQPTSTAAATSRSFSVDASFNRTPSSPLKASAEDASASAASARRLSPSASTLRADTSSPRDTARRLACNERKRPRGFAERSTRAWAQEEGSVVVESCGFVNSKYHVVARPCHVDHVTSVVGGRRKSFFFFVSW